MTSQLENQTIAKHILPNISKTKGIKIITLGQLIEYNMENIFLEKSYTKCGGETISRSFFKTQNWVYLWISSLKFHTVFCIAAFHTKRPGNYSICLPEQTFLAPIFVVKTNQVLRPFTTTTEQYLAYCIKWLSILKLND